MIAAIVLSNLVGTWTCTSGGEAPGMKALYTFHANGTGTLVWRAMSQHPRPFTFVLKYRGIVERYTDGGVTEWHNVTLTRNHLTDESNEHWDEQAGWIPHPLASVLNCKR